MNVEKELSCSDNWVARFYNLPPKDQLDFLFRLSMEEAIIDEIERKISDNFSE